MSRGICQCVSVRNSTQQNHIIRLYFSSKRVCKCSLIIRKFLSPVPLGRHPQLREVSSCFSCHYGRFYFKLSKKLQVWYCTTTTSSFFNKYKDNKTWVKINRNKTSFMIADCIIRWRCVSNREMLKPWSALERRFHIFNSILTVLKRC